MTKPLEGALYKALQVVYRIIKGVQTIAKLLVLSVYIMLNKNGDLSSSPLSLVIRLAFYFTVKYQEN